MHETQKSPNIKIASKAGKAGSHFNIGDVRAPGMTSILSQDLVIHFISAIQILAIADPCDGLDLELRMSW